MWAAGAFSTGTKLTLTTRPEFSSHSEQVLLQQEHSGHNKFKEDKEFFKAYPNLSTFFKIMIKIQTFSIWLSKLSKCYK
jgi:hypothetical protein